MTLRVDQRSKWTWLGFLISHPKFSSGWDRVFLDQISLRYGICHSGYSVESLLNEWGFTLFPTFSFPLGCICCSPEDYEKFFCSMSFFCSCDCQLIKEIRIFKIVRSFFSHRIKGSHCHFGFILGLIGSQQRKLWFFFLPSRISSPPIPPHVQFAAQVWTEYSLPLCSLPNLPEMPLPYLNDQYLSDLAGIQTLKTGNRNTSWSLVWGFTLSSFVSL